MKIRDVRATLLRFEGPAWLDAADASGGFCAGGKGLDGLAAEMRGPAERGFAAARMKAGRRVAGRAIIPVVSGRAAG